ncbi:MAG: SRPBCC family protein [Rhodobacteraceae bacterium]|nr:SRPBCC family protein [Paracoccaceae bacterium]
MHFTSVQDINAPLEYVFKQISDFDSYEAYAMRIGANVERRDQLVQKQAGMCWHFDGELRGKNRQIDIELHEYTPTKQIKLGFETAGLDAVATIEVIALTVKQTRMKVTVDMKARSISARLVMQSAKLAKNSLNRKFNHKVWTYANYIQGTTGKKRRRG